MSDVGLRTHRSVRGRPSIHKAKRQPINGESTNRILFRVYPKKENGLHTPKDVKPRTPVAEFHHNCNTFKHTFLPTSVAPLIGMSPNFIRKVVGNKSHLTASDVAILLNQDAFGETYVPRSQILAHLIAQKKPKAKFTSLRGAYSLLNGNALDLIAELEDRSVQCVVTSTPYWAMRLYDDMIPVRWADGDECVFGLEQTP